MKYVSGLGKLIITSAPSGAQIEIDGQRLRDNRGRPVTTDALRWPPAGRHHIKLILDGYETVDEDCEVEDENQSHFHKVLKPVKKP